MPIKFKCPNCQKGLSVKEQLAGKRAACPVCKKPLTIPAPAAADIEALAAAALADEPARPEAAPEPKTIDLNCPYCDEAIHMSVALGGKQAPCPECKRIIKVPMPVKRETTDWRQLEARGPSLARRDDEPAPEGAWGSTKKVAVSTESLEEAGALRVETEPLTLKQKIKRAVFVAAGVGALIVGWVLLSQLWSQSLQKRAESQALSYAGGIDGKDKLKVSTEAAGEVYRALGEMHLLAGEVEEARATFSKARARARIPSTVPFERDAVLLDVALDQVELGGSADQVNKKTRLSWEEAGKQWKQTLEAVSEAGETSAIRQVCRKVLRRAPDTFAYTLVALSDSRLPPPRPAAKTRKPRVVALLVALSKPETTERFFTTPKEKEVLDLAGRMIQWKRKPDLPAARDFFLKAAKDPVQDRLDCLLTVALAARAQDKKDEAAACVGAAFPLLAAAKKEDNLSPWLVLEWALLAQEMNENEQAARFAAAIRAPALLGRFHLEKYRAQARDSKDLAEDSWSQAVSDTNVLAHGLALEAYARNKARNGSGSEVLAALAGLEPERIRPLGFAGVAVGVQERGQ